MYRGGNLNPDGFPFPAEALMQLSLTACILRLVLAQGSGRRERRPGAIGTAKEGARHGGRFARKMRKNNTLCVKASMYLILRKRI